MKPKSYFQHILALDTETSGLFFNNDSPCFDPASGKHYQIVSIGLIVADSETLLPVEQLYLEIKWNGESLWDAKAQSIHGLTPEYLEENGVDEEQAVVEICNLILKYWGPTSSVSLLGHNVATFDIYFLKQLLRKFDIDIKFSRRHVDSLSAGFAAFTAYDSDDLFEAVGFKKRETHNSLTDAKQALNSVRIIRQLVQESFQ